MDAEKITLQHRLSELEERESELKISGERHAKETTRWLNEVSKQQSELLKRYEALIV